MARCTAITGSGKRCKGVPVGTSGLCAAHHPDYQERRRAGARRGGRARGAAELALIKEEIRDVIAAVQEGRLDRGTGAVVGTLFNVLLRAVEVERRARETDELAAELDELRALLDERSYA